MDAPNYGESSMTNGKSSAGRMPRRELAGGSLLRSRSSSKYGLAVIELRGSSEDGEDIDDSIPIVNHSTPKESNKIKPRFSTRETNHFAPNGELMWERPSLTSSRTEWVHEPDEVEEVLEKGNPPRRPARHVDVPNRSKRRKLDPRPSDQGPTDQFPSNMNISPRSSSPINLVSSSPSSPSTSYHHNRKPPSDSNLSPSNSPLVKAAQLSPAGFLELSTPRPTPPSTATPAPLHSDPPVSKRRDFQSEIIPALDAIYDGGRNRVAMREHEVFNLLAHLHVPEDHMAVMLTWERNTRQWGQMYFTKQVEYITRYIDTYGDIIDQYGARAALKFHFGRLLAEGRLCPPYQSTPSRLSIQERTIIQNSSALRVFNAVCRALNAYEPPR